MGNTSSTELDKSQRTSPRLYVDSNAAHPVLPINGRTNATSVMGNAISTVERPRAQRKLSKYRTGDTIGRSEIEYFPSKASSSNSLTTHRYSNSNLIGSVSPVAVSSSLHIPADYDGAVFRSNTNTGSNRATKPSLSPNLGSDRSARWDRSPHFPNRETLGAPSHTTYAIHQTQQFEQTLPTNSQNGLPEDRFGSQHAPNARRYSYSQEVHSITRVSSDSSLHVPTRRRSVVQTPGIATRSMQHDRNSFANRTLLSPQPHRMSMSSPSTSEIKPEKGVLLPLFPLAFDPEERSSTPCDADYRQLGVMKFGSLRIMNGSPTRSVTPSGESDTVSAVPSRFNLPSYGQDDTSNDPQKHESTKPSSSTSLGPKAVSFQRLQDRPVSTGSFSEHDMLVKEYLSPEVLHVREDADARSSSPNMQTGTQSDHEPISRTDSGFDSTSSSASSRNALTKTDSGYSSNFSLRSLRNSFSKLKDGEKSRGSSPIQRRCDDEKSRQHHIESRLPSSTVRELENWANYENDSLPNRSSSSKISLRPSTSSASSKGMRRLPFRSSITMESETLNMKRDVNAFSEPDRCIVRPKTADNPQKYNNLHRSLASNIEEETALFYPKHDIIAIIPAIPQGVSERLHQHISRFPTAPQRLALRKEPSKESLKTIMSVEGEVGIDSDETHPVPDQITECEKNYVPSSRQQRRHTLQTTSTSCSRGPRGRASSNSAVPKEQSINLRSAYSQHIAEVMGAANQYGVMESNTSQYMYTLEKKASAPTFRQVDASTLARLSTGELSRRRRSLKTPPPVSMMTRKSARFDEYNLPLRV